MTDRTLRFLLLRLWKHLEKSRRRQLTLLFVLMVFSAFAEIVSIAAVVPFIGVLSSPGKVFQYRAAAEISRFLGISSPEELVVPLTIAFATAAVIAGAMRILVSWLSARVTFAAGADLSIEIYRRTLHQPYSVHVSQSSNEMIAGITGKVGSTTLGVMLPVLTLLSSSVLLVAIMFALMAINPFVAISATLGFAACYACITWLARTRLRKNSKLIAEEQVKVVKALQEGLGGIRDVLLDGTQPVYCEVYRQADQRWRSAQGENVFIGQSPRFAIEAAGMVLIALLALSLSDNPGGLGAALPVIGALAVGAQRLLPVMQQGYAAWSSISGSQASFADTVSLLEQPMPAKSTDTATSALRFEKSIELENVRFRYSSDSPWVLDGIDFRIPKGQSIGIVGRTGSGKSSLLDVIMGLLEPAEGRLLVDGVPVTGDYVRAWQRMIAHVPQSIFLSDTTVAENIALGVRAEDIDLGRVREAARLAQIAGYIENEAAGYDAVVGERGIRLSGGQRQRIGIARALYKNASVLVLDEATSALDNATERLIIDALGRLGRELTVVKIAHRLTTLEHCDSIIHLDDGKIVAQGSYEDVVRNGFDLSTNEL